MLDPRDKKNLIDDGNKHIRSAIDRFMERRSRRLKQNVEERFEALLTARLIEIEGMESGEVEALILETADAALHDQTQGQIGRPVPRELSR